MNKIVVHCKGCGLDYKITQEELNLQKILGRDDFYCNGFCYNNYLTNRFYIYEYRNCLKEDCLNLFSVKPSSPKRYCSRGCASASSVTEYRRDRAKEIGIDNLAKGREISSVANSLRTREMWKYIEIEALLNKNYLEHQFEYPLERFVFDLALFWDRIFIEFDSNYHFDNNQILIDKEKEQLANSYNWRLVRIQTDYNNVIPSTVILPYL